MYLDNYQYKLDNVFIICLGAYNVSDHVYYCFSHIPWGSVR